MTASPLEAGQPHQSALMAPARPLITASHSQPSPGSLDWQMRSFNTTSIYHDNLILNICLVSGQQTQKLGNTEIYENIMKILSTEYHCTTRSHARSQTKTKAPEDAETHKNLGKVIQSDYINMHPFFYPVNGEHNEGKDHRDLLTLTPVVTITIQVCILRIDQSAALSISSLVTLSFWEINMLPKYKSRKMPTWRGLLNLRYPP